MPHIDTFFRCSKDKDDKDDAKMIKMYKDDKQMINIGKILFCQPEVVCRAEVALWASLSMLEVPSLWPSLRRGHTSRTRFREFCGEAAE